MEKTSFVCAGSRASTRAFVYSELPRKRSKEEFFAFFLSADSSGRETLKWLFRKAISTSRMGTARNYFLKFMNKISEKVEPDTDLFNGSIILLMIKRGDRIHLLHNRGVKIIHWDGSGREEGSEDIFTPLDLNGGVEQHDLFDKSTEELFSLKRIDRLAGNHTILFVPSEEFAARYREEFLDSVFFPSFGTGEGGNIKLETECDIPGIHWNMDERGAAEKERFSDRMKKMNVSIPIITGIIAAIIAIFIFFNPFGGNDQDEAGRENLLFSAQEDIEREPSADNAAGPSDESGAQEDAEAGEESIQAKSGGNRVESQEDQSAASIKLKMVRSWRKKFERPVTSSPATDGSGIIFGCRDGYLYSYSGDGTSRWKYNFNAGVGSSPVIVPGRRVVCADYQGDLACLETETGEKVWELPLGSKVVSTPASIGKLLFVGSMNGDLHCIDTDTGKEVWKRKLGDGIWSSIWAEGDHIVAATVDGFIKKLDRNGGIIWSETPGRDIYATPLCIPEEDLIVVGTIKGLISAFRLSDGVLKWQYAVNDEVRSTPATYGDNIVIGTDDGKVYCFNTAGRMKWMQDIGMAVRSKPLLKDGVVYITSYKSKLTAIDLSTGNVLAEYPTESRIYSSPLYYDGKIFFGTNGGFFHSVEVVSG
ncbi:MAG: PQQ-binding-like beta-propeller repeat protein [Candidatus Krumholzibacteriales bacterium]